MKKHYENPTAEKISFDYREQVVAFSCGGGFKPPKPTTPGKPTPTPGKPPVVDPIKPIALLGMCDWPIWDILGF